MQIKILNRKPNRVLKREEFEFELSGSKTTPNRKELVKKIAETINSKPELVTIQKIEQAFGTQENKATARVYETQEALEKTELRHLIGRDRGAKVKPGKKGNKKEIPKAKPQEEKTEKKVEAEKPNPEEKAPEKEAKEEKQEEKKE